MRYFAAEGGRHEALERHVLSEAGRRTLDKYASVRAKRERTLLRALKPAEMQELNRLMRKVLTGFRRDLGPADRLPGEADDETTV
jgi:hypothetical protein